MTELVLKEKTGGVLTLTLNRPEKKNALTPEMYRAIGEAIDAAPDDPEVRCVLIRGNGDMFCAGNDLGDFAKVNEGVGDAQFLVVAVDNGPHRRVYVGPAYSYYEFTLPSGQRMNDEEWAVRIRSGKAPEQAPFTRVFAPKGQKRAPIRGRR